MGTRIEIIEVDNQAEWSKKLAEISFCDFYHSLSYNSYHSNIGEKPILYCFKQDNYSILFPLVIREIGLSHYKDVTSVYGYAGPIASHSNIPSDVLTSFSDSISIFFQEKNIVSAFSRLHPSFKNEALLNAIGEIVPLSETVYIDLTIPLDEQKSRYRKGVKSDLSKLNRGEYFVFEDTEKKYISEFIEIYNENMVRVGARPEYFFDKAYYDMIFNSQDINSKLYFVVKENVKIAASIFVFSGNIIQYHLSGTRGDYLKNSPVRLIIDHVRVFGTENGYNELHLGGGVGSSEDSLFKFKAGFSDCRHQFKVWRYIVNPDVYNQLVQEHNPHPNSTYFPLYRAPK